MPKPRHYIHQSAFRPVTRRRIAKPPATAMSDAALNRAIHRIHAKARHAATLQRQIDAWQDGLVGWGDTE